ncbi:MAG: LuxR C-terminal-related transcriptional regulator [Clostridiaceae bacterium]
MQEANKRKKMKLCSIEKLGKELSHTTEYPLTVVSAPMGYGKTTAVRDFVESSCLRHIWLTLTEASVNHGYFWDRLTEQISTVNPELGLQLKHIGFPADNISISRITDLIAGLTPERPFLIILDDYHITENDSINRLLEELARRKAANLHYIIIGRNRPGIAMEELSAKNLLLHIDTEFFLFSDADVSRYFSIMGCPVLSADISRIQDIAQGWISALYLIYMGMQSKIPIDKVNSVYELMRHSIYNSYPEETKIILMMLSELDGFTMELAGVVTQNRNISELIRNLYQNNAFITLDQATGIFTIHNVFLKLLREEAFQAGINIMDVCRRAGRWYLERKNYTLAFRYLSRAEDYETILEELEKPGLYITTVNRSVIFRLFNVIGEEIKLKYPIAYLKYILLENNSGERLNAAEMLAAFEIKTADMERNDQYYEIQAEIHIVKIFLNFNNVTNMLYHVDKARKLLNGKISKIASYQGPFSFGSPHFVYIYYKKAGAFRKTANLIAEQFEKYADLSDGNGMGCSSLAIAEYALETGDFDRVEREAYKSIYKAKNYGQTSLIACAALTLVRLELFRGNYRRSEELLSDLSNTVAADAETILLNTYDLCLGYFYACTGRTDNISDWIRKCDMSVNSLLLQGMVFAYVVYGKAMVSSGNWVQAEAMCENFISRFDVFGNQLGYLHNYINLAIATSKLNDIHKSREWLKKALVIGQADNIVMPFAENGENLLPILETYTENDGFDLQYLRRLIQLCREYSDTVRSLNQSRIPLSKREKEVLKLLADGYKQQEIADSLYISLITVKKHLQNIYKKLDAENKTQAINRASQLRII